jgi:hypothetical protein
MIQIPTRPSQRPPIDSLQILYARPTTSSGTEDMIYALELKSTLYKWHEGQS